MPKTHLQIIQELIATTNNGKLMLRNIQIPVRESVPALIAAGKLNPATFMVFADSVTLPTN